jgi:hypothetical protein
MKVLIYYMFALALLPTVATAIDPPKGLLWGQTHEEVVATLNELPKDERIEAKQSKKSEDLPEGFEAAEIKNVKLFGKKTEEARVVFDPTGGLCAVQYAFVWQNTEKTDNMFESANKGRDKSWEYHDELFQALRTKYGEPGTTIPMELQGRDVSSGTKLKTEWVDSLTGDKILLAITRQKRNVVLTMIDNYIVVLLYHSPSYTEAKKDETRESDDI